MSIIHDALKKAQQAQGAKTDDTWTSAPHTQDFPVERLPSSPKKARSVLALICAIALTLGSLVFCYKQLHPYVYRLERMAKASFYRLIHQKEPQAFKTRAPEDLKPLAKINVPPLKPVNPPSPTALPNSAGTPGLVSTPAVSISANPNVPETLNIHGVMASGSNDVVLINNQVYQEGDEIDGIKIVKISLDYITVMNNGKEEKISVKN